ncbi:MAG: EH signature domain-containing protein [Rivularia sp. (in: cyanobacteria)]
MNFNFPEPSSSPASKSIPEQLVKLSNQLPYVNIPLPTVDKVIKDIKQNRVHEVTELEWIYCIHVKEKWDEVNLNFRRETSQLIWRVAINNQWLRHKLLWRLALYYGGNKHELATSLAISFSVLANSPTVNQLLPVKIMQAVVSNNSGLKLAEITCEQNLTRSELLNHIQNDLPIWIPQFSQFTECISSYFCNISFPNQQQVNWLLRCLDEMSSELQGNTVNHLLINVSKEVASNHPQLVEWLRENYRNGEKWNLLSDQAKVKLREWIGAVNYADFQNLVDLILKEIKLKQWEDNQLKKRRKFWADYTNRFQQLRILAPQSSLDAIRNLHRGNVDLLKDDGSDTTEVCIFDFGECLVAEFFRGKGSETRLFPNNHRNQQILFGNSGLSVKRIRCLGGVRHDHKYLWQFLCREWLEDKGIQSNPGTSPGGTPTPDQFRQRQTKLEQWNNEIERLEQEAKDYCNKIGFCVT